MSNEKIKAQVERKVKRIKQSLVFTVGSLKFPPQESANVRSVLNNMVSSGRLKKAGRGLFYVEKESVFGKSAPDFSSLIHDIMYPGGKIRGYLTGLSIWHGMGLTTQFTGTKIIAHNDRKKKSIVIGNEKLYFQFQPIKINRRNVLLLQILDTIKNLNRIPDCTTYNALRGLIRIINEHIVRRRSNDIPYFIKLTLKYPPKTRALTGAMLEALGIVDQSSPLLKSLSKHSRFKISDVGSLLPEYRKWHLYKNCHG